MTIRRKLAIAGSCFLAAAILTFGVVRWASKPPQAVRLLPEGELLVYVNLKPLHFFDSKTSNPVSPDPDYQAFIDQTNIQFERDLDQVAISMRNPGAEAETSSIFRGRFDLNKLQSYLQKLAISSEKYGEKTVFSILHEGRTVRVCILADDEVAVTNMASPEPMRSVIDKFRHPARAGQGPFLAQSYYPYVPFFSAAWLVYRTPSQPGTTQLPEGLSFDFLQNTTGVVSLRLPLWFSGECKLKAEVFTENEAAAAEVAESAHNYLSLYRSIAQSLGTKGSDRDISKAFDSIQVEQKENRAIFTTTISQASLKKLGSAAQIGIQEPSSSGKNP
ncbi:MAG TPA: hypothetical protein VG759_11295 [Candidatus Angelobacter sp.]|jgi:hypothetical protein|nr:hypothetical protein [Candidatus Angelobacter sp.]